MSDWDEQQILEPTRTALFEQLGILCLDGSGSMTVKGDRGLSLADNVNDAVREFLTFFKGSRKASNFSIAVITFDGNAVPHTETTKLLDIDDNADYNPLNGHGGGTNIGAALLEAERFANGFLSTSSEVPRSVIIIVMSDGECGSPASTKSIAAGLKQNNNIKICSTLFTSRGNIGSDEANRAADVLKEIASSPNHYKTISTQRELRDFFVASSENN